MGADLICYIAKGPKKFSQPQRRAADRWLRQLWGPLKKAYHRWEQEGTVEKSPAALELRRVMRGLQVSESKRHSTIWVGPADPDDFYLDEVVSSYRWLKELKEATPSRFLRVFLDFWVRGTPRDTATRDDPDNRAQQIVVAGEMSWGDEPEGYGYQMLKAANYLQLMPLLGIR